MYSLLQFLYLAKAQAESELRDAQAAASALSNRRQGIIAVNYARAASRLVALNKLADEDRSSELQETLQGLPGDDKGGPSSCLQEA